MGFAQRSILSKSILTEMQGLKEEWEVIGKDGRWGILHALMK